MDRDADTRPTAPAFHKTHQDVRLGENQPAALLREQLRKGRRQSLSAEKTEQGRKGLQGQKGQEITELVTILGLYVLAVLYVLAFGFCGVGS
jgi:hypothetical protein